MTTAETTDLQVIRRGWDREHIELLKQTICAGATDAELSLFVEASKRLGLDPFARQVFAVKRWDGNARREVMSIQVSIDGFRLVAERTGKYAGQLGPLWTADGKEWAEVWLSSTPPAAAKVGVLRHDFKEPVWSVATWEQYKQTKRDGGLSPMWVKMGPLMLAKCAESLALRRAFPNELSGVYTAEEMQQAEPTVEVDPIDPGYRSVVNDFRSTTNTQQKETEHGEGQPGGSDQAVLRGGRRTAGEDGRDEGAHRAGPQGAGRDGVPGDGLGPRRGGSVASEDSRPGPVVQPPPSATASPVPAGPTKKSNDSGAKDIAHDGVVATKAQVGRLHMLRAQIPTLNATPDHPESAWKKTIRVYRKQDGSRCEHSNDLSKQQASHLIQRMEEKATKLAQAEAEIRNGTDTRGETMPQSSGFELPVNWLEFIHDSFLSASDEDAFLKDIGYDSAEAVPAESRELVAKLVRSIKDREAYKKAWDEALQKGAIRP